MGNTEAKRADKYREKVEAERIKRRAESAAGRDLGKFPRVKSPRRKSAAIKSFRKFCESYFPRMFNCPWSADHLKVIDKIETSVRDGGRFAMAMPRGSGKTSLCIASALWASLSGLHRFVAIIGATEPAAESVLRAVMSELENNPLLLEDFPEVCLPIRRQEGIRNRRFLYRGVPVRMDFRHKTVTLPEIEGSRANGAAIRVAGLTGNLRGMIHTRGDGETVRPSMILVDDPQTDESARSATQCRDRERLLNGAVMGLAGPADKLSVIMPCTVIFPGDLADTILDNDRNPQWRGEKTKLVYKWPTDRALWNRYEEIRKADLIDGTKNADKFYVDNREAMDAGAVVAWESRKGSDLSAIQHAYNLRMDIGREAFDAEYQNAPKAPKSSKAVSLSSDDVAKRINRIDRGCVPVRASVLTAFVDVQKSILFYAVCAFERDFTGYVIDYGTWPDQKSTHINLDNLRRTFADEFPGAGDEGALYGSLEKLVNSLVKRDWKRDDGSAGKIDRVLIDANFQTATVKRYVRQSGFGNLVMPAHGRYVGAASRSWADWSHSPGDRISTDFDWKIPAKTQPGQPRHVLFDANRWKSCVASRLKTAIGDSGALTLFGDRGIYHVDFADHLTAEESVLTTGRGRDVEEWRLKPGATRNDWLDCVVGCHVAASVSGVTLDCGNGNATQAARPRRRIKRIVM